MQTHENKGTSSTQNLQPPRRLEKMSAFSERKSLLLSMSFCNLATESAVEDAVDFGSDSAQFLEG